uniref:Uncharacterized protein n=1 Tax=Nelumbo nucifera TaxID=4432 RepID=A0A822XK19_NELNU|nr:TPA_asm: hypothetical protein HUJ06_020759 [Nelumbo nucifera]
MKEKLLLEIENGKENRKLKLLRKVYPPQTTFHQKINLVWADLNLFTR